MDSPFAAPRPDSLPANAGRGIVGASVALRSLSAAPTGDRRLRRGEAGHRHAEGRARDVVELGRVAEGDRRRIAAVLAADADFEAGAHLAAALGADADQLAHPLLVDGDERVGGEDRLL